MRTHVRGHDDNRVAEIDRAPLVVGQATIVQDLQQDVEDIGMGLLNLVEQHHRVGLAPYRLGQLTTLVVTDISRRRTHKARHGMTLLVLRHINTGHHAVVVEEEFGQRLR